MSEGIKSRKCEDCGHIFEYALWASSCPNCTSTHLQVVDGPPPQPKKKVVQLISDAPVADPNRHVAEAKLIHHDGVRESHLEIPDGGIPLIIDEESRPRPSSLLLHEVKLILDESSEPYMSKLDMEEIELLIMDIEDQYRPDPDAPPVKPMTPEEIAKAAVKKRLERLKSQNMDMDLPPISADGGALPPIQHGVDNTSLSFGRKSQRLERADTTVPQPQASVASPEKKGFLSRRKTKIEEPPAQAPRKTMFTNTPGNVDFNEELGPNRSLALPEVEEMSPPRSRFRSPPREGSQDIIGKRELPVENEKGKREIIDPDPVVPTAQPVAQVTQPVTQVAQPVAQVAQPVAPVVPTAQPVGQVAQPVAQVAQPVAPVVPTAQPVTQVAQPVGQVAQPVGQVAQPVAPVVPTAQPVAQVAQPVAPVVPTAQPVGQVAQPVAQVAQPVGQVAQPVGQVAQPVAQVAQPVAQVAQPVAQVAQPVEQVAQPVGQVAQPVTQVAQPVAQVAQPVSQVAQPVAQVAQPVTQVAQPVGQVAQAGEPMENTARRRFNLPPLEAVEDDILPPITADGKLIPPLHHAPDPGNVGIGRKPRLQPPVQEPAKKGFFKKKK